ncbi:hypothetical protein IFT82_10015 [Sphingomonas sp. CFBP 8760]|nr:hypothetical protein [Sphingomonas sp. CFBP 8760]
MDERVEPLMHPGDARGGITARPQRHHRGDEPVDAGADAEPGGAGRRALDRIDHGQADAGPQDAQHQLDRDGDDDAGEDRTP